MKIFRKIRFELIGKNEKGKYLKYAIGEIVLVVIGILIALQINNWSQIKKDNKALKEYLVKIKAHTLQDIKTLDSIRIFRKRTGDQCKLARRHILNKTEEDNLYLFLSCGGAFFDYYFNSNTGGYESLKNSNYFGKINNTPLDSLLTRYHYLVEEIEQNENTYNDYIRSQETFLSTQFDRSLVMASAFVPQDSLRKLATPQSEYIEDFKEYTSSISYRNVIGMAAFQFDLIVFQYDELMHVGEGVVDEINILIED